jgi:hypothetical protein
MDQKSIGALTVIGGLALSSSAAGVLAYEFNRVVEPWILGLLFVAAIAGGGIALFGIFAMASAPAKRRRSRNALRRGVAPR